MYLKKLKKYLTFIALMFLPSISFADLERASVSRSKFENIELSELVQFALSQYEKIGSVESQAKSWVSLSEDAQSLQNPISYIGLGPSRQNGQLGPRGEFGIKQPLPLWGKRELNSKFYLNKKDLSEVEIKKLKVEREAYVIKISYRLEDLIHELNHQKEREARFVLLKKHLEAFPYSSPEKMTEKTIIVNRLNLITNKKITIESEISGLQSMLSQLTGKGQNIRPKIKWIRTFKTKLSYPTLRAEIFENNPNIETAKIENTIADINLAQARVKYKPDVSLGTMITYEKSSGEQKLAMVTLDTSLPFLNSGEHLEEAANHLQKSRKQEENSMLKELTQEFEMLWSKFGSSRKRVELYSIPKEEECKDSLDKAHAQLREGLLGINTFLEFDSQCLELHHETFNAQLDYVFNLIDLYAMKGTSPLMISEFK